MFEKILVANRGEIAVRIIRACKELDIRTVAVYSEADWKAPCPAGRRSHLHRHAPSPQSYLRIDRIISAAEIADVDAIHPGYGFLAENAHFADVCESCNIRFIGPPASAMRAGGQGVRPRCARKAGVPVAPGSDGTVDGEEERDPDCQEDRLSGHDQGGRRRWRTRHARRQQRSSLVQGLPRRAHEAEKAFGNPGVYIEKFIENPHHIEFQILADEQGHIIHLGERDCSIQRRNQKVVEECPSPLMTPELRARMGEAAVKLAETSATPTPARSSSSSMTTGIFTSWR